MTDDINAKNVSAAFVWGSQTVPENLLNPDLIRPGDSTDSAFAITLNTPLTEYMTTGPGRFAFGDQFAIVRNFFYQGLGGKILAPREYSKAKLQLA
jgi:hypothetical protein